MKKYLLSLLAIGLISITNAQKETDNWFFGVNSGLDFTSGAPVQQAGASYSMSEGCASISTSAGALLFYSDGTQIWNANHTLMPNGTDLHGDISSTQSCIIVPKPGSATQYYIFTTDSDGDTAGFKYSIVDMTLQSGLGDVTSSKNISVQDTVTEKLVAIRTTVGGTYWIVTHQWNTDAFYSYQLTALGLQAPVISHTGTVHNSSVIQNTYGQMKFNMCGTKLAVAIGYQDIIEVFDFNLNTGTVSNPMTLTMNDHVYGVEFSPNSDLLYVSTYDITGTLLQYNISLATMPLILASRTPLTVTPDIYGLQIASDGKIYVARSFGSQYLGVINSPNTPSVGCNYVENGVDLDTAFMGNTSALSLPGFMQTYLKNTLSIVCPGAGIDDEILNGIGIYPNPSADEFFIAFSEITTPVALTTYDCSGKMIEEMVISENGVFTFGKRYQAGIYFVRMSIGGDFRTFKMIKT